MRLSVTHGSIGATFPISFRGGARLAVGTAWRRWLVAAPRLALGSPAYGAGVVLLHYAASATGERAARVGSLGGSAPIEHAALSSLGPGSYTAPGLPLRFRFAVDLIRSVQSGQRSLSGRWCRRLSLQQTRCRQFYYAWVLPVLFSDP